MARFGVALIFGAACLGVAFGAAFERDFTVAFGEARFGAAFLVDVTFVALFARALPAGERLVAGFSRVDLVTRFRPPAVFAAERPPERDESLFSGLPILEAVNLKSCSNRRLNGAKLNTAFALIQCKNGICG